MSENKPAATNQTVLRISVEAKVDPKTVRRYLAGKPGKPSVRARVEAAARAVGVLAFLLCWQACESSRTGVHLEGADAGADGLGPPRRGPAGSDAQLLTFEDAEPQVGDALAVTLDALAESDARAAGSDVVVPADLGRGDVADTVPSGVEAGREAQASDGPPPIPADTCTSTMVKAGAYCQGNWPGTNPPVRCAASCLDYAAWVAGTSAGPIAIQNPLLGCNSYDMTSATAGRPVVCLSGQSFCDIYCPVAK